MNKMQPYGNRVLSRGQVRPGETAIVVGGGEVVYLSAAEPRDNGVLVAKRIEVTCVIIKQHDRVEAGSVSVRSAAAYASRPVFMPGTLVSVYA
jgi:hypothetical protein